MLDNVIPFDFAATRLTPSWNATGITVAGMGIYSTAANGLNYPYGMALDATASNVYLTDQYNNRVQKWAIGGLTGVTVAGQSNAVAGATASDLHVPCGIVLDSTGGFYVADSQNYRVQYWSNGSSSGTTFAGTGKPVRDTSQSSNRAHLRSST
jgi:sugar lactone lactonase YvrE